MLKFKKACINWRLFSLDFNTKSVPLHCIVGIVQRLDKGNIATRLLPFCHSQTFAFCTTTSVSIPA